MALLSINLDAVGILREGHSTKDPDPTQAAVLAEVAGADGVSVQYIPNRRAIRERDLYLLREVVRTRLTIDIPATEETISRVLEVKPWMVTLISAMAGTESGGQTLDTSDTTEVRNFVARLQGAGILAGILVSPTPDAAKIAQRVGANAVVIDCSAYSSARKIDETQRELDLIDKAAESVAKAKISCKGARAITYKSISPLVELGFFDEFFVGHAIVSKALLVGLPQAVQEMVQLVRVQVVKKP